jgi:putative alpha-1,2-mannosidase
VLVFGEKMSNIALDADLARQMQILPDKTSKETSYERAVKLTQSQRNVLIISENQLLKLSYLSCEMIVVINDIVTIPMANMVFAKNSSLQSLFQHA